MKEQTKAGIAVLLRATFSTWFLKKQWSPRQMLGSIGESSLEMGFVHSSLTGDRAAWRGDN